MSRVSGTILVQLPRERSIRGRNRRSFISKGQSMKSRFLIATCLGIAAAASPLAWGVLPPAQPALPNYDKRTTLGVQPAENDARQAALARLRLRLPTVDVVRDRVLGTPRFVH